MINNWTERIRERMEILRLTQEVLASKIGVTQSAITHYLTGRRVPPLRQFQKLAAVLEVDPAWLQFGNQLTSAPATEKSQHSVPIISWHQAAEFAEATKRKQSETEEYVPHFYTDQPGWYALRVKGDSMIAVSGHSQSFRAQDIIIINPDKKPEHESYVVASARRSKEATFKQYVIDGGIQYLKPLNPQYPLVEIDENISICGVVVSRISSFI
jgi:SOS-response transcriptional repressor LexA